MEYPIRNSCSYHNQNIVLFINILCAHGHCHMIVTLKSSVAAHSAEKVVVALYPCDNLNKTCHISITFSLFVKIGHSV